MSAANLLVGPEEIAGATLRLEGDRYRHLFRARRLAVGAVLRLVDGAGGARSAVVAAIDRHAALLRLGEPLPARDPSRAVTLLVAMPRGERASWLVEKATELGVAAVRFLASERGVRTVGARDLERLRRVAAAALEQSGGARLPALSGPHAAGELPALLDGEPAAWLDPGGDTSLAALAPAPAALLVGPEGGWSAPERAAFGTLGLRPAHLGTRVLRVETAAVAGATVLLLGAAAAEREGARRPPVD